MNHSSEMVKAAYAALSDKKGEDIRIIDIRNVSVMADYFIIASGSNSNPVQAMVDNVEKWAAPAVRWKVISLPTGSLWITATSSYTSLTVTTDSSMIWSASGAMGRHWMSVN